MQYNTPIVGDSKLYPKTDATAISDWQWSAEQLSAAGGIKE